MKFNQFNLDARLFEGIKRAGFFDATPIQEKAIPIALAGHDMIATAQTGTGKTAAFILPILNKLLAGKLRHSRALIITPTRELAEQIHQTVKQLRPSKRIRQCICIWWSRRSKPDRYAPQRLRDHCRLPWPLTRSLAK